MQIVKNSGLFGCCSQDNFDHVHRDFFSKKKAQKKNSCGKT